jgi:hypothetical protein
VNVQMLGGDIKGFLRHKICSLLYTGLSLNYQKIYITALWPLPFFKRFARTSHGELLRLFPSPQKTCGQLHGCLASGSKSDYKKPLFPLKTTLYTPPSTV